MKKTVHLKFLFENLDLTPLYSIEAAKFITANTNIDISVNIDLLFPLKIPKPLELIGKDCVVSEKSYLAKIVFNEFQYLPLYRERS